MRRILCSTLALASSLVARRVLACADALVARRQVDRLHGRGPADRADPPPRLAVRADRRRPWPSGRLDPAVGLSALGDSQGFRGFGAPGRVDQPLTAPGWSPDGRALAFGRWSCPARRLGPIRGGDPRRADPAAGRLEPAARRDHRRGGQVARPGDRLEPRRPLPRRSPSSIPLGLAIIRADNGRQVNAINDAFLPSWSPDGSRLAFYLRGTGDTLNCIDSPLGQPRMLLEVGQGGQAPVWTRDGLTLLVAARKSIPEGETRPATRSN